MMNGLETRQLGVGCGVLPSAATSRASCHITRARAHGRALSKMGAHARARTRNPCPRNPIQSLYTVRRTTHVHKAEHFGSVRQSIPL